jgi:hypothetical protein
MGPVEKRTYLVAGYNRAREAIFNRLKGKLVYPNTILCDWWAPEQERLLFEAVRTAFGATVLDLSDFGGSLASEFRRTVLFDRDLHALTGPRLFDWLLRQCERARASVVCVLVPEPYWRNLDFDVRLGVLTDICRLRTGKTLVLTYQTCTLEKGDPNRLARVRDELGVSGIWVDLNEGELAALKLAGQTGGAP